MSNMVGSPRLFIKNRQDALAMTNQRVIEILGYLIFCYLKIIKDSPTYSQKWVATNTSLAFEDYLKIELVEKYLIPNKKYLKRKISALEEINFAYETQQVYRASDGKLKVDKIDIIINKIGLQKVWSGPDEHLYFAVECKRIRSKTDSRAYLNDIKKVCERSHINLRLPYEGMIAFMENSKYKSETFAQDLNTGISTFPGINVKDNLKSFKIRAPFKMSYRSVHKRKLKLEFSIYHLFFDYSNLIKS